ncbi:hypothetical protein [Bacillus salipaludis]|nr:hypothetical protein [Bacillus salipaludis]
MPIENLLECLGIFLEILLLDLALLVACIFGFNSTRIANAICAAARSVNP